MLKKLTYLSDYELLNISYIAKAKILNKYHIIYDFMIKNLLIKYTDLIIVTDKITNYKLLKYYSKFVNRLYIEVPSLKHYNSSKNIGFYYTMINIKTSSDLSNIISFLSNRNSLFGIVIGANIFYTCKKQLIILFEKGIHIYVWGVNSESDVKNAFCKYVSGFYID